MGISGSSRMKKYELEKTIRDLNTKATKTGDKVCDRCLEQQHKQRLINEKMFGKKCLENAIPNLCYRCESCGGERMIIDGDEKL